MTTSNIAGAINAAHNKVETANLDSIRYATEAGRLLIQAKATVAHGAWIDWVKTNCSFSARTAQLYMRVADYLADDDPAKTQRVAHLGLGELDRELTIASAKPFKSKAYVFILDEKEAAAIRVADWFIRHSSGNDFSEIKKLLRDVSHPELSALITARANTPEVHLTDRNPPDWSPSAQAEIDRFMRAS